MTEIVHAMDLREWGQATEAAHHNEVAAVIFDICDQATAESAILPPKKFETIIDGYLDFDVLGETFKAALIASHNSSHPQQLERIDDGTKWSLYRCGGTGLHIDSLPDSLPGNGEAKSLNLSFLAKGNVEVLFVPINKDMELNDDGLPQSVSDLMYEGRGSDTELPSGLQIDNFDTRFVPSEMAKEVGHVITQTAGQILAFSAYHDVSGRLATAHQFISLGETVEERNARTTSSIETRDIVFQQQKAMAQLALR